MNVITRSPRVLRFPIILLVLITFSFAVPSFAKHRKSSGSSRSARSSRGKHVASSHRGRRGGGRTASRRGGRSSRRLSAREVRAERGRIAREQSSSLKALERRLRRPLTKRERTAELRRIEGRHRRDLELARRRAEAARQAAIARQRAIDAAMRQEVQTFISRDQTVGEDPEVRRVAINALGNHAGTVVVMDPKTGRVYAAVNQEWGVRRGFKPCSTIKLVTGLAGLNEKVIDNNYAEATYDRYQLDLTSALAHSNNTYFQRVGGLVGFDKMISYARELGLGEKTGINDSNENAGRVPSFKSGFALNRMSSHGDDFEVTAVQLATLVSAMANGGKLLTPQVPRTRQEEAQFKTKVRRQVNIEADAWQRMVPGMVGAVNYGSGKKAYDPAQTVAGKTGTCIGDNRTWMGLFTSYAPLVNPKLAVVVITRGTDAHNHLPAAVAGQIYRDLNHRFGTPTNLPIATAPTNGANDAKADDIDEESKEAEEERAKEEGETQVDTSLMNEASTQPDAKTPNSSATNSKVKRVIMPVNKKTDETLKPAITAKPPVKSTIPEERPRRVGEKP
jgi:membrane peptidoglycan carboxypeptidase